MRSLFTALGSTFGIFLFSLASARAETVPSEFADHSVPVSSITCKTVDFDSYFEAQRAKSNLIRTNPDRTHPNFAGKYLLLRNEMLLENRWFVVDCASGKVFHETISGKATFRPDSALVILGEEGNQASKQDRQLWSGDDWIKLESIEKLAAGAAEIPANNFPKASATSVKTEVPQITSSTPVKPATAASPLAQYEALFALHHTTGESITCKKLDFNSYFKAESSKANLIKLNSELSHPNFAGKYLLLKNETILETVWFIADCASGKFFPVFLTDRVRFQPDSNLVIVNATGSYPQLLIWADDQWIQKVDPVQNKKKKVTNLIQGESALLLSKAIPHAKSENEIRFQHLECTTLAGKSTCTVKLAANPARTVEIPSENAAAVMEITRKYGTDQTLLMPGRTLFTINSGKCSVEHKSCTTECVAEEAL